MKTYSLPSIRYSLLLLVGCFCASSAFSASSKPLEFFLKSFYTLDEPRFFCVDIPGHKSRVNTSRPLSVHTCKEGIWHRDEIFYSLDYSKSLLKMPDYDLCMEPESLKQSSKIYLKTCSRVSRQVWRYQNYRLVLENHPTKCLTIGGKASRLTRGGKRLPSKHRARTLVLATCSQGALERQMWRFEAPQLRNGSILPFGD